jgi:hypothetical protein
VIRDDTGIVATCKLLSVSAPQSLISEVVIWCFVAELKEILHLAQY